MTSPTNELSSLKAHPFLQRFAGYSYIWLKRRHLMAMFLRTHEGNNEETLDGFGGI